MEQIRENASVQRVVLALKSAGRNCEITILSESARSAKEAADALHIEVGQIASSIVFRLPHEMPLLVITSGRHRVDTERVSRALGVDALHRADAAFVRQWSGFAIGGVSPLGWTTNEATVLIDVALNDYQVVWAAAGHPHAVFPTSFDDLREVTGAISMVVGD